MGGALWVILLQLWTRCHKNDMFTVWNPICNDTWKVIIQKIKLFGNMYVAYSFIERITFNKNGEENICLLLLLPYGG